MSETLQKWSDLLHKQAGFDVTRVGADMELAPKNVLVPAPSFNSNAFEMEIQLLEKGSYFLNVNGGENFACTCTQSPTKGAHYIDNQTPIRQVIKPDDVLILELSVIWEDTKKRMHTQLLFQGTFKVPHEMQFMGSPGYNVHIPHLDTHMYLSVGNIITKGGDVNLELLSVHVVLLA
jgi:hypothetical protein